MAETEKTDTEGDATPRKKSKLPLILGAVLAIALGGAGFYGVYSGLILGSDDKHGDDHADLKPMEALPDVAFVPVDPLTISLGPGSSNRHLRFRAELEVEPKAESEVTAMLPRVLDVLNSYLRAVSIADLEQPTALIKLRAQMLRRVQLVTGEGRVRDLLIMEFVLN